MISKPRNAHDCMKVFYTHRIPPTCFGHSCGHLQGGVLQRIDTSTLKYYRSFVPMCRNKVLNFKNNAWVKMHIKN